MQLLQRTSQLKHVRRVSRCAGTRQSIVMSGRGRAGGLRTSQRAQASRRAPGLQSPGGRTVRFLGPGHHRPLEAQRLWHVRLGLPVRHADDGGRGQSAQGVHDGREPECVSCDDCAAIGSRDAVKVAVPCDYGCRFESIDRGGFVPPRKLPRQVRVDRSWKSRLHGYSRRGSA
jgi:hypothetical protein